VSGCDRPSGWRSALARSPCLVLAVDYGRLPWIAVVLAISFGSYGLIKKIASVDAVESLTVETLTLLLPALIYLTVLQVKGTGTFGGEGAGHALLLAGGGLVTAVPLLCFGAAAISVPMTVLGLLQYIAPVLQFLCGVLIVHETMPAGRWAGFAIVWLALAVFTWDALRTAPDATRAARPLAQPEPAQGRLTTAQDVRPPGLRTTLNRRADGYAGKTPGA